MILPWWAYLAGSGAGIVGLYYVGRRFIRSMKKWANAEGERDVAVKEKEAAERAKADAERQRDIANRPDSSIDAVLERMSHDGL